MTDGQFLQIQARLDAMDRSRERGRIETREEMKALRESIDAYARAWGDRIRILEAERDREKGREEARPRWGRIVAGAIAGSAGVAGTVSSIVVIASR